MNDAANMVQPGPARRPPSAAWLRCAASLPLLVRIDARRPASWLALLGGAVAAAAAMVGGGADHAAQSLVGVLAGALAAVAAIGDLPIDAGGTIAGGRRRGAVVWAGARAAWPLAGMAAGVAVAGAMFPSASSSGCLAGLLLGSLGATIVVSVSRIAGAKAADAASLAFLLAAASAGLTLACYLVWLALGGAAWLWWRAWAAGDPFTAAVAGPASDVLHVDALPANGPLRENLARIAMASMLAAMAGWLVSQIEHAGRTHGLDRAAVAWGLLSAAWFMGLVVPQALLQDGATGAGGWDRLFRTAARAAGGAAGMAAGTGRPRSSAWRLRWPRPGRTRFAAGVALSQAAILGWPPLVCAALSLAVPERALPPAAIVAGLAVAAASVAAAAALGAAVAASRETVYAAVLAAVVGVSSLIHQVATPLFQGGDLPASPSPPSFVPDRSSGPAKPADDASNERHQHRRISC
jgi:hypothetical protein